MDTELPKVCGKDHFSVCKIVKRRELGAGFALARQTPEVMVLGCGRVSVQMEKILYELSDLLLGSQQVAPSQGKQGLCCEI